MSLETGARLGRYEIRGLLGRGGMGEVYLALDPQLDRHVALKVLPAEVAGDADRMRRFEREAKAASALNHPGILTIYEIGKAGSTSFIAAERVEGVTMRERMQRGALPPAEAIEVAVQIAAALAVAHAAGIVHRDVKPENVMVRRDGLVKLLDFGLSRIDPVQVPGDAATETHTAIATRAGAVLGTARYMSPEQACGLPVDARTDVWSLGVVLYEMLTGRAPIEGGTTGEILSALVAGNEPPPLARFLPDAPADLQRVVSRALAPNRDARYHSMQDMALDLKELKESRGAEARMSGRGSSIQANATAVLASTAASRGRLQPWLLAAALLAAAAVTALYLRRAGMNPDTIDSLAVLPFESPGADAETELLADGFTESLNNSLSRLNDLRIIARPSVMRYKGKEVDPSEVARKLDVRALVTGRLTRSGDQLQIGVELSDVRENRHLWGEQLQVRPSELLATQARISADIAEKLRSRLPRHEQERLARGATENPEAYKLYLQGRYYWYKFPRPEYQKSRTYFEQAIDVDPTYALAYAGLSHYYGFSASNGLLSPVEAWPKAKEAVEKALELDPDLAEGHQRLASVKMYVDHDWAGAERSFRRAIELNPNYAEGYPLFGTMLLILGRAEESLATRLTAQKLDPLSAVFHRRDAWQLFAMRRFTESVAESRMALELDPGDPMAHEALGLTYELAGRQPDAIREWASALRLQGSEDLALLLEQSFAKSGFEPAVRALAGAKLERSKVRKERGEYVPAMSFVKLYLRLGEREKAFEWLAAAEHELNRPLLVIGVEPEFDSIRDDPRFVELLRRIGLPPNPLGVGLVRSAG